jgi:hypothetical protein
VAALEEYRAEQKIVASSDPKAQLSSGELMASIKGRLHPVAKLGGDLRQAVVSVFRTLLPGRVMSTHASVLVDSVGPPSAEVCRAAASFP